jgi:hypothetical protein
MPDPTAERVLDGALLRWAGVSLMRTSTTWAGRSCWRLSSSPLEARCWSAPTNEGRATEAVQDAARAPATEAF